MNLVQKYFRGLPLKRVAIATAALLSFGSVRGALLVNEVRPWAGSTGVGELVPSLVELYNTGPGSVSLNDYYLLAVGQTDITISLPSWFLPARSYLTVYLGTGTDDSDFADSTGSYYAGEVGILQRNAGEVGLYRISPLQILDFVNWGTGSSSFGPAYSAAVSAGIWTSGAFLDIGNHSGLAQLGRVPSGWDNNTVNNWHELELPLVVPLSVHNPIQLYPRDGVLQDTVNVLTWKALPGVSNYTVQVDNDSDFSSPLINTLIFFSTSLNVTLADGEYYWRVIPGIPGGPYPAARWNFTKAVPAARAFGFVPVPQRFQHKDSRLLCIWHFANRSRPGCTEAAGAAGAWDAPHPQGAHIPGCPHCNQYCTRASIQMVNAKYGGSLTQDEISYHGYQDKLAGPEGDLGHGVGMWPQENSTYSWAMNNAGIAENFIAPDAPIPWATLTSEIDGGWPVLTVIRPPGWFHTVVFNGYFELPLFGTRFIHMMDPWPGRTGWYRHDRMPCVRFYILPAAVPGGRATDPNVTADADGDGVVNFDEQHPDPASEQVPRPFCSNWTIADTDLDEVRDKQEIRSYTFHDTDHGGHDNDALTFPDLDGDGLRAECDCDTDNDSDFDGGEDINGDGRNPVGGLETCEYDAAALMMFTGVLMFPGPVLCTEDVFLFGQTFHQFSWYPYELIAGCPPPVDGMGLGWSGVVFSVANGIIPPQYIGTFPPGIYRVITDVLRDHLYSEPDNWDPWLCFGVPPHCYLVIDDPTTVPDPSTFYVPTLDALGIQYLLRTVPLGQDGPTFAELSPWSVVIWVCATANVSTITPNDAVSLMQYLDSGGKLLLTGQGILRDFMMNPDPSTQLFAQQYLRAFNPIIVPVSCDRIQPDPAGFLSGLGQIHVNGPGGANYPNYSPEAFLTNSIPVAQWPPSSCPLPPQSTAVNGREDLTLNSRNAFMSFAWEGITDFETRTDVMRRTLNWLYGTQPPPPAVSDLTIIPAGNTVQLNWTAVPTAIQYNVHAGTSPDFLPDPSNQITATNQNSAIDPEGVDGHLRRFYKVVAIGANQHGHGGEQLREWVSNQTEISTIVSELERRKVRYRLSVTPGSH